MMSVMPDPLTGEDRRAGFDWAFSIAQLEVSDTAVFDQPRRARAWFEAAIGDHLDLGRPERVALVVDRRVINRGPYKTPGRFATEIITRDVAPQLQIHYKSSKAKAYLKEGRALRVETTVNNATDFAVHKTLNTENWRALRRVGADTNARFLAALGEDQPGLPDPAELEAIVLPSVHDGQRAPGLRFGDPRTMSLLASIAAFAHVMGGLTNRSLRAQMAELWHPTTAPRRPPTTSAGSGSKASSNASTAPTPTESHPTGFASPRCSPNSQHASRSLRSPTSLYSHGHDHQHPDASPPRGAPTKENSTPPYATPGSPHDPKLASTLQNPESKCT